jgi:hypothetical protein
VAPMGRDGGILLAYGGRTLALVLPGSIGPSATQLGQMSCHEPALASAQVETGRSTEFV